jgi:putative lysine transport system substrate-binding protein
MLKGVRIMKKAKKLVSLVLCAAILAGTCAIFTGCTASSSKKVLKVGMECAYAPFNWIQTNADNGAVKVSNADGQYAYGYDIIMAKKIAESIGYELQIVKTEWDGLAPGVSSGKLDAVIAGMSITADRKKTVDFSDVYYNASIVALVKKDGKYATAKSVADLKGATCTSQQNTVWYKMLDQIPSAKIQPALADVPAMIVALSSGKTEVLATDKPTAMAAVYSNSNLVMLNFDASGAFKASDEDVQMGIAIKKGNTELKDKINKALAGISEKDREAMMQDAIQHQPLAK